MRQNPLKDLARDPVCGLEIDRATAASIEHLGHVYYFCCRACFDAFLRAPDSFLGARRLAQDDRRGS